ncbi:condensation domain-containing protein [Flavitalea sp.]|nr:condensation domain-containing protein [Flavitalea sp.]
MQVAKAKVEAMYPLNFLQQALLFHSLQEGVDQGFLRVKCVLKGKIDIEAFQNAWRQTIQRHEVLRTSVHWENMEKPVQVVHKEVLFPFTFHDWSENSESEQKTKFDELTNSDASASLNLTKAPVLRILLIRLPADKHILLWYCHHILVDGWSASIILQDLLAFYDAYSSGEIAASLPAVPSYKSYLSWIKNQDQGKSKTFWTEVLKDFERPTLVGNRTQSQKSLVNNFQTKSLKLSQDESQKLRDFSQKNQITLNTLIQGVWAILLSKCVEREDIAFGTIVSGRSIDLPNAALMAGMYMNVLPLRIRLNDSEKFSDWLKSLQFHQAKLRAFEYCNMDEVMNSSSSAGGNLLFDSVVVFENMPLENIRGGGVLIENFESGLTSNYALTLAVSPLREIKAHLKYDSSVVSEQQISWFINNLSDLFAVILENKSDSLREIRNIMTPLETNKTLKQFENSDNTANRNYLAPRSEAELMLVGIWESMLNLQPIGVNEDFFDLGGTSIIAIRLFTEIEKRFQKKLQPISLLNHRTVEALSKFIAEENKEAKFSSLVPLRASGSKRPVFCLHAGGGHVFFYKDLAKHLGSDQPVYALQRLGVDDITQAAQDIESTASYYLGEIRKVQPRGPYSLLAYCFSISICWEMVRQLQEAGDSTSIIAMIDSSPPLQVKKRTNTDRLNGIITRAKALDFSFIKTIWKGRVKQPIRERWISLVSDKQAIQLQKKLKTLTLIGAAYIWKPLPVKITLIRSAPFLSNERKNEKFSKWNDLALNGVDTYVVDGHHRNLFNEPEVQQLAVQLRECLDKANNLDKANK